MWNPKKRFLFTEEEYNSAKSSSYLSFQCMHCRQEGRVKKARIKRLMEGKEANIAKYCSKACRAAATKREIVRVKLICHACSEEYEVYPSIAKGRRRQKHWYCSNSCRLQAAREDREEWNIRNST